MDGSVEGCGATMTYLVSKTVNAYNKNLAYLSVVGACGDIQDRVGYRLTGLNEISLKDAVENGDVIVRKDLRLFGRETRPIVQFLQYGNDPAIPGITDNNEGCKQLLTSHGIQPKYSMVWNDLTEEQKGPIREEILSLVDPKDKDAILGDVYTLPNFPKEGGLRDAKEFATSLNSCGRYDDAPTGMRICFGDRRAVKDAENNRSEHRRNISAALQHVKESGDGVQATQFNVVGADNLRELKDAQVNASTTMTESEKKAALAANKAYRQWWVFDAGETVTVTYKIMMPKTGTWNVEVLGDTDSFTVSPTSGTLAGTNASATYITLTITSNATAKKSIYLKTTVTSEGETYNLDSETQLYDMRGYHYFIVNGDVNTTAL